MIFMRIDDRFIHGQVGVTWISYVGATELVLINDSLASDSLASMMQKMSAPTSRVVIKSMKDGINYLKQNNDQKRKKMFVIVSSPQDVLRILESGIKIEELNIGHSAHKLDSVEIYPKLFVGKEELEAYKKIEELGISFDLRLVPDHKSRKVVFKDKNI